MKNPVRVVLVEPEYQINLGHCCRAMKNFGFTELYLVNPQCKAGEEARKYSKHALDVLLGAKTVGKLADAIKGCGTVVGTSGVLKRHKHVIRNPISVKEFAKMKHSGKIALLFGREGIGLTEKEIGACDILVHVPTHHTYPIMNLSHALAIVLYELSSLHLQDEKEMAGENEKKQAIKFFERMAMGAGLNNPKKTVSAFRRVLGRANPTKLEANCILGVFRRTLGKHISKGDV